MIILIGPDGTGKSTLAKALELPTYHFTKESRYEDYLEPLCNLELTNAVLDRHIICEYPYSKVMHRDFAFTMKQWQNIILLTLAQYPLIILCTRKPIQAHYDQEQYLPYDKWDICLKIYKSFLTSHHIKHIEYDYLGPISTNVIKTLNDKHVEEMEWWRHMWRVGYGYIGSTYPKVLLVAERLGPNNMNNLPFETGPTGRMLEETLTLTRTPFGKFAVTNMVKSYRGATRGPDKDDFDFFREELVHLKPEKVVFMGSVARQGVKITNELGIEHIEIPHFGYWNHKGISEVAKIPRFLDDWHDIMGIKQ